MAHILALLPLLLSSSQSAHPHPPLTSGGSGGAGPAPAEGGGPFEYSYEYRNGVNVTNATAAAADIGNATNVVGYDLNSTTAEAAAVGVDSAAIPYSGSVSFLYRNRRQKRRNLGRRFLHGGE